MIEQTVRTIGTHDGGSAFPNPYYSDVNGMSKREYFAIHILQGILSGLYANPDATISWTTQGNVTAAYEIADAMLKQSREP